eukprot:1655309-Pleurochrysis_carterae.AAC.1
MRSHFSCGYWVAFNVGKVLLRTLACRRHGQGLYGMHSCVEVPSRLRTPAWTDAQQPRLGSKPDIAQAFSDQAFSCKRMLIQRRCKNRLHRNGASIREVHDNQQQPIGSIIRCW